MRMLLAALLSLLPACKNSAVADTKTAKAVDTFEDVLVLADFENGEVPALLEFGDSEGHIVDYEGGKVLRLKLNTPENTYSGLVVRPKEPLDLSSYGSISIAFDAVSIGQHTTQLLISPQDTSGKDHTRSEIIHSEKMRTYYSPLTLSSMSSGKKDDWTEFNLASGMRSDPPMFQVDAKQLAWMWGTRNLDLKGIKRINMSSMSSPHSKELLIDNIRIVRNPPLDVDFLKGIVDQYGQAAKNDYPEKIKSDEELIRRRDTEMEALKVGTFPSRSKWGGWLDGPRLKATGFFRTEKVNGKWSLVDPNGHLYLSMGVAVIRRGDTQTATGLDTAKEFNEHTDLKEYEYKTVSKTRREMFQWLPEKSDELASHYSYMFEAHSGVQKRGLTFDFYGANLQRKYGAENHLRMWRQVTLDRMVNWGFTTLGNWADPALYNNGKIPYIANRWIRGNYKTVSSGMDFWEPLPDVFDPAYKQVVQNTVQDVANEIKGSPWCVGVFFDNEMSFGRPFSDNTRYGIVINTLQRDGAEVPTKAAFTKIMRGRYSSIEELNKAWELKLNSWDAFEQGVDSKIRTKQQAQDYAVLLEAYADQYFKVINEAMDQYLPNHLYLGARFADWGMPLEVVRASAKHVDVISFNYYKEGFFDPFWSFLKELDKPCIIGEFGNGASGRDHYHYGIVAAQNQKDRAKKYKDYLNTVLDNPYFVGAHWFQYLDSPLTGRSYDGENYNNGFVSVTDTPYQPMVNAAKEFNTSMYERRFGKPEAKK